MDYFVNYNHAVLLSRIYNHRMDNHEYIVFNRLEDRFEFILNGKYHRIDKPAVIKYYPDGKINYEAYYINGKLYIETFYINDKFEYR